MNEMRDLICSECGCKKFYVCYRAFVVDVIINEKRNVIEFDKKNVEIDLNTYDEFCYCVDCGREIDFEEGDYEEE